MESGYKDNPYHNATHAADVLQSMHVLLHRGGLAGGYTNPLELLACYLAAAIHDYQHPGLTNDFLINTFHALALQYNDKSPLESYHTAAGLTLLHKPATAFLPHCTREELAALRKLVRGASHQ